MGPLVIGSTVYGVDLNAKNHIRPGVVVDVPGFGTAIQWVGAAGPSFVLEDAIIDRADAELAAKSAMARNVEMFEKRRASKEAAKKKTTKRQHAAKEAQIRHEIDEMNSCDG